MCVCVCVCVWGWVDVRDHKKEGGTNFKDRLHTKLLLPVCDVAMWLLKCIT